MLTFWLLGPDAALLAKYLEGEAHYPKVDDHTAAVIDFKGTKGKLLHIDILSVVLGLK